MELKTASITRIVVLKNYETYHISNIIDQELEKVWNQDYLILSDYIEILRKLGRDDLVEKWKARQEMQNRDPEHRKAFQEAAAKFSGYLKGKNNEK